jgi:hypothetical protein
MEFNLVIELKIALADIGYFVWLTLVGNSQYNLDKSRDEFKSEMRQGTWQNFNNFALEDIAHST